MSSARPTDVRRVVIAALVTAMVAATLALPVIAATGHVTGTLTLKETIALSGKAVAVVTIVDLAAAPDAGAIVAESSGSTGSPRSPSDSRSRTIRPGSTPSIRTACSRR